MPNLRRSHCGNSSWTLHPKSESHIAFQSLDSPLSVIIELIGIYRFVRSCSWRYLSDAITKDEALAILKAKEAGKKEREANVIKKGYPVGS